eukprot:GHVS01005603.1.p1 GENE.GHVS01005603.1~~GHVS01005603.1.p1  ORF type:complete len:498 (+),score=62.31 GHVS01005603.1:98-1591(+)
MSLFTTSSRCVPFVPILLSFFSLLGTNDRFHVGPKLCTCERHGYFTVQLGYPQVDFGDGQYPQADYILFPEGGIIPQPVVQLDAEGITEKPLNLVDWQTKKNNEVDAHELASANESADSPQEPVTSELLDTERRTEIIDLVKDAAEPINIMLQPVYEAEVTMDMLEVLVEEAFDRRKSVVVWLDALGDKRDSYLQEYRNRYYRGAYRKSVLSRQHKKYSPGKWETKAILLPNKFIECHHITSNDQVGQITPGVTNIEKKNVGEEFTLWEVNLSDVDEETCLSLVSISNGKRINVDRHVWMLSDPSLTGFIMLDDEIWKSFNPMALTLHQEVSAEATLFRPGGNIDVTFSIPKDTEIVNITLLAITNYLPTIGQPAPLSTTTTWKSLDSGIMNRVKAPIDQPLQPVNHPVLSYLVQFPWTPPTPPPSPPPTPPTPPPSPRNSISHDISPLQTLHPHRAFSRDPSPSPPRPPTPPDAPERKRGIHSDRNIGTLVKGLAP